MSTEKSEKQFVVSGRAFWTCHETVNKESGKYQMDLSLDAETAKRLKDQGYTVRTEGDGKGADPAKYTGTENDRGQYITLKSQYAPKLVDAKKNTIPTGLKIGNGSTVNVMTHAYDWTFKNKKGRSLGLDAIQVLSLVEYSDKSTDLLPELSTGYTVSSSSVAGNNDENNEVEF